MILQSINELLLDFKELGTFLEGNRDYYCFRFCEKFDAELGWDTGAYAVDVFNFVFDLNTLKNRITDDYEMLLEDFILLDFQQKQSVYDFMNSNYNYMVKRNQMKCIKHFGLNSPIKNDFRSQESVSEYFEQMRAWL